MQEKNIPFVKKILLSLASYVGAKGIRGLAAYLGVPDSSLYSWISRNSIGDPSVILKKIPNARIEWLETGKGEMFSGEAPSVVNEQVTGYSPPTGQGERQGLSPEKKILWEAVEKMSDDEALELVLEYRRRIRGQERK